MRYTVAPRSLFLASGANPFFDVAPRSLFFRVKQLKSQKGQLRHGAEWINPSSKNEHDKGNAFEAIQQPKFSFIQSKRIRYSSIVSLRLKPDKFAQLKYSFTFEWKHY